MDNLKVNNLKAILKKTCSEHQFCKDDINYIIENFYTTFPGKNPNNLMPINYRHDDYIYDNIYYDLDGEIVLLNSTTCSWEIIRKIELSTTKKLITGSNVENNYKNLKLLPESLPNISYTFYDLQNVQEVMGVLQSLFLRFDNYTLLKKLNDDDLSDQIHVTLSEDIILEILDFGEVYKIIKNKKCISAFKDASANFQIGDALTKIFQSEDKNKFCIINTGDVSSVIIIQINSE